MFRQHIPNFVDVNSVMSSDALTTEEVLCLSWVDIWTKSKEHSFIMWSTSDRSLVAIFDNYKYWFVVGYADFDLDLPKFSEIISYEN